MNVRRQQYALEPGEGDKSSALLVWLILLLYDDYQSDVTFRT